MDSLTIFKAILTLFAIVNPVGSIPIFLELTARMKPQERGKVFRTGTFTGAVILLVFILAGERIFLHVFQIRLNDLMAAGGLLLLIIAIDHLVFGALVKGVQTAKGENSHHIGAVPIACPILAGPGAMMTVILIATQAGFVPAIIAVVTVFALTWLVFRFIDHIYRVLGEVVCIVLSKILCLFIAAIGVRMLMGALVNYFNP